MTLLFWLESKVCPRCTLIMKVVREGEHGALTVRYDVSTWARECIHSDCGGPLCCPCMQSSVRSWLDQPKKAPYEVTSDSSP